MRLELDILLAALSLYLCPDIYLEDLPLEMEMGKGWGLYFYLLHWMGAYFQQFDLLFIY